MVAKIFIDGEAGTTGLQIRERLAGRRDLDVISIAHDKRKDLDERKRLLNAADVAILCLPDDAAKQSVSLIENDTTKVIDASTAYRVDPDWTYGFAEMEPGQTEAIAKARRVANPGCWPQGLIASLRPLIEARLLPGDYPVSYHGISGYSGGGRQMIEDYEAAGTTPSQFMPYGLSFKHKHLPEMQAYSGLNRAPLFEPVVGNFAQGMTNSVPLHLDMVAEIPTGKDLHAALADYYAAISDGFVRVAPYEAGLAKTAALDPQTHNGTNVMTLHVFANDETAQAVIVSVYDNLGKGASGAAVQNLNIMLGVDPRESLEG
ncbi:MULTISPECIES: N-acetyl-gamma-glutamyl-phosphate reductase [Devosia]|uniref:N-acetyl-gamma-glutamyl-phosphate reductase n=1 Tax=Devosia equisanguinis TaxID=2490941 RepID=A0A3S4DN90_9HYPH|nr:MULTISPECIES: N-acetyl-gamma-glutamyl-phosphate reductase [Devosia]ODT51258.1 MAG: N-acetyl-gamma-glutamyl-phosphate reductase [Pelagibacterium sp. SCN 63-126]ODU84218.1 MAG: N-acetyl-gamma-glutamyl-phosphate reductase [Pelagibacterium sp. SCN 63-17]OJX41722.1 MAG: N-acetyl-gamma-glutamyl-phosphate reductase [Devosia sp. 63-57]VDS03320.1 N-acetyl-gamma-glutamyl-phosphate reductase [Devosia equisanguinis]